MKVEANGVKTQLAEVTIIEDEKGKKCEEKWEKKKEKRRGEGFGNIIT